jgi:ankyrin repeat protein
MDTQKILTLLAAGRSDLMIELMNISNWRELLMQGEIKPLQWLVYYNDVTALRAVLAQGGDLSSLDLDQELGHAAFFGHWKVCDFLIEQGADVNYSRSDTGETALHSALAKAGRPYYLYVVKLLLERGANVNAATLTGKTTEAFMRDVRTRGETPLHRAAAYADSAVIALLLEHGANKEARDVNGDTPLSWASAHLRPARVLKLLCYGEHRISEAAAERNTSDHGAGWGNGMEWNLLGDYAPLSK